jgi:hypothetical protein
MRPVSHRNETPSRAADLGCYSPSPCTLENQNEAVWATSTPPRHAVAAAYVI